MEVERLRRFSLHKEVQSADQVTILNNGEVEIWWDRGYQRFLSFPTRLSAHPFSPVILPCSNIFSAHFETLQHAPVSWLAWTIVTFTTSRILWFSWRMYLQSSMKRLCVLLVLWVLRRLLFASPLYWLKAWRLMVPNPLVALFYSHLSLPVDHQLELQLCKNPLGRNYPLVTTHTRYLSIYPHYYYNGVKKHNLLVAP